MAWLKYMTYKLLNKDEEKTVTKMGKRFYNEFIKDNTFKQNKRKFGIEIEFSIIDSNNQLVPQSAPYISSKLEKYPVTPEYGSYQIEINPPPLDVATNSYKKLYDTIQNIRKKIDEITNEKNYQLIPIGIPFYIDNIDFHSKNIITPTERYLISTTYFHKVNKKGSSLLFKNNDEINLPGNSGLSIINELHIHLQAFNKTDLISIFNYSQMITAPFVALAANSGMVNGKQLKYKDFQISIFEQAEGLFDGPNDIPRTGLFPGYINTVDDFFSKVIEFKPLYFPKDGLDSTAFELIIGKYFGWTRIRIGYEKSPHLRIEFRPMSSQPTIIENIALTEFFINSILGLVNNNNDLLPAEFLKNNLISAMKDGMKAKLYWDMGTGTKKYPVNQILYFLLDLSSKNNYSEFISDRISKKCSPSEKLIEYTSKFGYKKTIEHYTNCYVNETP